MLSRAKSCDNVAILRSKKLAIGLIGAALFALCATTPTALAQSAFRPRIGHAFGLVPAHGQRTDPATAISIPLVYHGGVVMHKVRIHAIFWGPLRVPVQRSTVVGDAGHRALIERFLGDVAHDSGSAAGVAASGLPRGSYTAT